jgi:hypothetical protein
MFFDDYPWFYHTGNTAGNKDRVNMRYRYMIEPVRWIFKNKIVLDIASHDARWAFAALHAGARKVVCVEPRAELIDQSIENMNKCGINPLQYEFIKADIHEIIQEFPPENFDVIMCLGYFHHCLQQWQLLNEWRRLNPYHVLLDVVVWKDDNKVPIIKLSLEPTQTRNDSSINGDTHALIGKTNIAGLEMMLSHFGFTYEYLPWPDSLKDVKEENVAAYMNKERFSLLASTNRSSRKSRLLA